MNFQISSVFLDILEAFFLENGPLRIELGNLYLYTFSMSLKGRSSSSNLSCTHTLLQCVLLVNLRKHKLIFPLSILPAPHRCSSASSFYHDPLDSFCLPETFWKTTWGRYKQILKQELKISWTAWVANCKGADSKVSLREDLLFAVTQVPLP